MISKKELNNYAAMLKLQINDINNHTAFTKDGTKRRNDIFEFEKELRKSLSTDTYKVFVAWSKSLNRLLFYAHSGDDQSIQRSAEETYLYTQLLNCEDVICQE